MAKGCAPIRVAKIDVLFGRGSGISRHEGNVKFRNIISEHRFEYCNMKRKDKIVLAGKIVKHIQSKGGRFLVKSDDGTYTVADHSRCLEKTCQALREKTNNGEHVDKASHTNKAVVDTVSVTAPAKATRATVRRAKGKKRIQKAVAKTKKNVSKGKKGCKKRGRPKKNQDVIAPPFILFSDKRIMPYRSAKAKKLDDTHEEVQSDAADKGSQNHMCDGEVDSVVGVKTEEFDDKDDETYAESVSSDLSDDDIFSNERTTTKKLLQGMHLSSKNNNNKIIASSTTAVTANEKDDDDDEDDYDLELNNTKTNRDDKHLRDDTLLLSPVKCMAPRSTSHCLYGFVPSSPLVPTPNKLNFGASQGDDPCTPCTPRSRTISAKSLYSPLRSGEDSATQPPLLIRGYSIESFSCVELDEDLQMCVDEYDDDDIFFNSSPVPLTNTFAQVFSGTGTTTYSGEQHRREFAAPHRISDAMSPSSIFDMEIAKTASV